jgi:hypothetical protein
VSNQPVGPSIQLWNTLTVYSAIGRMARGQRPDAPQFPPPATISFDSFHPSKVRKRKFTEDEDTRLAELVAQHGASSWKKIAMHMNGRSVRQCRERWKYFLEPTINRGDWTLDEDNLLLAKYDEIGPKWAQISAFFRSRTDIDLKNRFHRIQRGKQIPSKPEQETERDPDDRPSAPRSFLTDLLIDDTTDRNFDGAPFPSDRDEIQTATAPRKVQSRRIALPRATDRTANDRPPK